MALIPLHINTVPAGAPANGQTLRYSGAQLVLANELKNDGTSLYLVNKTRIGSSVLPSGLLHLAAGASTAGSGQIKLDISPLLLTPENGVLEFDGALNVTEGGERCNLIRLRANLTGTPQSGHIHITGNYSSQGKIGLGNAAGFTPAERIDINGTGPQRINLNADAATGVTELRLNIDQVSGKKLQIIHNGNGTAGNFGGQVVNGNVIINFFANGKKLMIGSSLDSDLYFVTNDITRGVINAAGDWSVSHAGGKIGYFGVNPVVRQAGAGAVVAGALWDATSRDMLNAVYSAMRNYGQLT